MTKAKFPTNDDKVLLNLFTTIVEVADSKFHRSILNLVHQMDQKESNLFWWLGMSTLKFSHKVPPHEHQLLKP